jgi:hypothetical protein
MSQAVPGAAGFERSRECFEKALGWLKGAEASALTHAEIEDQLDCRGRELLRSMCQDHFNLRAVTETRLDAVLDNEAVTHGTVEAAQRRPLATIFGEVEVERLAYRHRGHQNLYPADGVLNLPQERHSHGLRRMAAVEASRGSFEETSDAISRATGQQVAKRQVETLAGHAALDVEEFYATRTTANEEADDDDVLVISVDGKGIVMRPDALRPATAKAAAESPTSWSVASPKARNGTTSASPRSEPSTSSPPWSAAPPTSWPPSTARTRHQRRRQEPSG